MSRLLDAAGIPNQKNPEKSDRKVMIQWDIEAHLGERRFTIEAKFDQMASQTGNLAIEYWNVKQAKPSGILATTADLWVVVLQEPVAAWLARTKDLKHYFETVKPYREIGCGGDDNSAMKLFRKDEILPSVFKRVDDLAPWELRGTIKDLLGANVERADYAIAG